MRKLILLILPALYLGACTETVVTTPPPKKTVRTHTTKTDNAEDFHAVEKPATYR
ncbi:MAG: hypothetical protein ACJ8M4_07015 [Chthoniobacterales bacterium]